MEKYELHLDDALNFLTMRNLNNEKPISLCYIDPPFNTGKTQKLGDYYYEDSYDNYITFIRNISEQIYESLHSNGSLLFHIDYREAHYVKIMLDSIFGRNNFMNEIIWAYDYGGRPKNRWPCKHDTIFWYVKNNKNYTFNYDEIDRIPYMAPGLVGDEKALQGKTPTDVFWHTIVPTNGKERVGYPTQKPLGLIRRFIKVHSNLEDTVLDCFCGSGTFGVAAIENGRYPILVDQNPQAIEISKQRINSLMEGQ